MAGVVVSYSVTRIGLVKANARSGYENLGRQPWRPEAELKFMKLQEIIEKFGDDETDEFLKFDRVTNKLSNRPDLHAFLLLDRLVPRDRDMVSGAAHDEIYLDVEPAELEGITEEQVVELIRCGVRYDSHTDSLAMFV